MNRINSTLSAFCACSRAFPNTAATLSQLSDRSKHSAPLGLQKERKDCSKQKNFPASLSTFTNNILLDTVTVAPTPLLLLLATPKRT
jgi:hypothetical protein